jgi:thioredoxin 1
MIIASEKVLKLTGDNFDKYIEDDIPILVDFWATWCMPCLGLAPIIDQLSEEYSDKMNVGKVDIDEQLEVAAKFNVKSIPTVIIFKNGKPVERTVGAREKKEYDDLISKYI